MVLYPLFKTGYHQAWTEAPAKTEAAMNPDEKTEQEAPDFWQWSKTAVYPADEPEPPAPYDTAEHMPHKIIVPEEG